MTLARIDPSWPILTVDFQAQLGSLLMGTGTAYRIATIDGMGLPPIRAADSDRAFASGSFGGTDLAGKRDVTMEFNIVPGSGDPGMNVLLRNLIAAFAPRSIDTALALRIPDIGSLVLIGRPRRCEVIYDSAAGRGRRARVAALFSALDPLKYAAALQDVLIAYGTAGTNAGVVANAATLLGIPSTMLRMIQNGGFVSANPTDGGWVTTVATDLAAGATLTRDTGIVHSSGASGKLVTSGAASNQGVRQPTLANLLPNTSYTFTAWVNLTTMGGSVRLLARDVTNAVLAVSPTVVNTTGSWQQLTVVLVTGATGPVQVMLTVRDEGTAVTRTFYTTELRGDLTAAAQAWAAPLMGVTAGAIGGGGGAAGFSQLVSAGNTATKPVSKIRALTGPVTGPLYLDRVESNESLILNYNMASGDVLELDHDLHSVILNGVTNRADILDANTSWWSLSPGTNTIHYRTAGPGVGSQAEVLYRDAYW